jgi:glycosyltransferase involved in cell wall biosynthesis
MQLRPLRICHLGKYYPPAPGGIETHVRTLATAQAALGAYVRVLCVNHTDTRGRDVTWSRYGATETRTEIDHGVRVTRLGRSAHAAKLDIVPELRKYFRRFKSDPVDVLHLHTPNPTMLLAVAALRPWAPLVITHHSDVVKQRKLYLAFAPFERIVYERAARIISNSPDYIDGSDILQANRAKVQSLAMGLDLHEFQHPSAEAIRHAAELRKRFTGPLWLSVGRCVYYKGYDTALRALRSVPGNLIIIGQGPYQAGLVQMARDIGVADRVHWWGYATRDELIGSYQAATAFWFPSNARSEAFGLVQVEAMASGCPVINTRIPASGVAWVSMHEKTGLTTTVGDVYGFAAAANRLLSEAGLRQALSQRARVEAAERFAHTTMAARSLAVYADMIEQPMQAIAALPAGSELQAGSIWSRDLPASAHSRKWRLPIPPPVPLSGAASSSWQ